jgi:transcription termination factor Rho
MKSKVYFCNYKKKSTLELEEICKENNIAYEDNHASMLSAIMRHLLKDHEVYYKGHLEIINNNYGFLRNSENNFIPSQYDIYINKESIRENKLRFGDYIECIVSERNDQKFVYAKEVINVNNEKPGLRPCFEDFTAQYPNEQIIFERKLNTSSNTEKSYNDIARTIDLIAPIGFGQRTMVVAPPQTGKTTVMHSISRAILENYPEVKLIILLIGERPEEVTEMKEIAPEAEILFSTFDQPAENHIRTSEMVYERCKRLVEMGKKVVVLLDSITRLVRSYNTVVPSSGKVLSGGIEASSLQKPKQFFGAARNTKEAGSLTIIATGLIDTGSKMDDLTYEEFKGTGNCEIKLDRQAANRKLYPALKIDSSETRRAEKMMVPILNGKRNLLKRYLCTMDNINALEFLVSKIKMTSSNEMFLNSMQNNTQ